MYHKLTVYVKRRYHDGNCALRYAKHQSGKEEAPKQNTQTICFGVLFPSCCFGDKYHKYHGNSINTWQISFTFLHTVHNDMFQRCTIRI